MKIKIASNHERDEALKIAHGLKKWFTKSALTQMKSNFKKNLLVLVNRGTIGFVNYRINKKNIKILWMAIKKEEQGKGFGSEAIKKIEQIAKKRRIDKITVETLSYTDLYTPYKSTRKFYLRNGFVYRLIKKSKKKGYDDLVVMEKTLK